MKERFEDLIGGIDDLDPATRERLRGVHELLLQVTPPPEVPHELRQPPAAAPVRFLPQRRRFTLALIAAALVAAAFGSGYFLGGRSDDVSALRTISMAGAGDGRGAFGSIALLPQDESGNWPLDVKIRGLAPSRDRSDFYELWLTKDGKLAESCGRFTVHDGVTEVLLSVPYGLKAFDGWVVTRHGSEKPLLST